MMRQLWLVLLTSVLTGCALFSDPSLRRIPLNDQEPTVSFVETKPVTVPKSDIVAVDADQVVSSYLRLMESPHAEVRRQATRRLADLNMRLAEEKNIMLDEGKSIETLPLAIRQSSYERAAELYQQVIDEFPKQNDDASIRYQLARALAMQGKADESLTQMDALVAEHDQSPEMIEVQFRRGEGYFLRQQYRDASIAYQAVVEFGDKSEFYDKALYKHGWSLFKTLDYEAALNSFFPLLERLKAGTGLEGDVKGVLNELIADTQRAISLSFFHLDGPESIKQYFAKNGSREYEHEIYQNLAQLYLTQQRYQDAASSYLAFVNTNPAHEKAAFFQLSVIKTYIDGGFPSLVLPSKEAFLTKFGVKSNYWSVASDNLKASLRPHIITNLEEVSSHYHSVAQKEKKRDSYLIAANWYSHFLVLIKDEREVGRYHFLMAEALFDAKEYEAAIEAFDTIAYSYKNDPKQQQAAYNILLSYQAMSDQANPSTKQAFEKRFADYSLLYVSYFPNSSRSPELLARATENYLADGNISEAIRSSEWLLKLSAPKTKAQSDRALIVIADGLFDLKYYPEAELAITEVLNKTSVAGPQRIEFKERRAQAIYQQAAELKSAGQSRAAVKEFQRLVMLEPGSSVRVNAELDAAVLLMNLEDWAAAKVALEGFRGRFVTHPLAEGIDERLAVVYEKLELWGDAAGAYKRISANTKDPNKKQAIEWYIAELYMKEGNTSQAITAFETYYQNNPRPLVRAVEAAAKLVELYEQVNQPGKRDLWRGRIIQSYSSGGKDNTDRTRYLAAKMSFELAEPFYERFRSIKLTLPLPKSLKDKRAAMDRALAEYGKIGRFKVAEFTTASTHRVGQLYLTLARDIINSERPSGMSEDEAEEYGYLIEDQAFPIEEKAINIFVSNSDRVLTNVYDEWVKRSFAELAKLQPARYNKQEVVEVWIGGN
ncbi:MAG: tetratricopeptide repeat protein [Gammaproteobacteria bacterium]|nr:tetratricopeptide repeat protein [Gammaproteobacteria bacterium]